MPEFITSANPTQLTIGLGAIIAIVVVNWDRIGPWLESKSNRRKGVRHSSFDGIYAELNQGERNWLLAKQMHDRAKEAGNKGAMAAAAELALHFLDSNETLEGTLIESDEK